MLRQQRAMKITVVHAGYGNDIVLFQGGKERNLKLVNKSLQNLWIFMGRAMWERNLLNVRNVEKALELALTLLNTREFTLKRSPINVSNVISGLDGVQILISTYWHTKELNHIDAHGVDKALVITQIYTHT